MVLDKNNLMQRIWGKFEINLPLEPGCNIFEEMKESNTTWNDLMNMLTDFLNLRNKYIGYNLGNTTFYLTRKNKQFVFYINSSLDFILWDKNQNSLGHYSIENSDRNEVPTEDFIKWITNITEDYCNDIVYCSDCRKKIKKSEIAGHFYSGIYCETCWEREYKELEAKENYD